MPRRGDLSQQAKEIYEAALAAVDPKRLMKESVLRVAALNAESRLIGGEKIKVLSESFDLDSFKKIFVIAFGKAAAGMAEVLAEILGDRLTEGLAVVPGPRREERRNQPATAAPEPAARNQGKNCRTERVTYITAAHPVPDERSVEAARLALALASKAEKHDLVFVCISGGGSALLCLPAEGITLEDKQLVTQGLIRAGATIQELNAVRKHLSGVKGGRLAKAAFPATIINLVISDVNGDDLEAIASGPTHWDSSRFKGARDILKKHGIWEKTGAGVRALVEKGMRGAAEETLKKRDRVFKKVHTFVVGNNLVALQGARREAERLGFETYILSSSDEGEARKAAHDYVAFIAGLACSMTASPKPVCLLAGGEVTVTVKGKGIGGRNTEFVLASLLELTRGEVAEALCKACGGSSPRGLEWLVLSLGTDGIDGLTDAAGAFADAATIERASKLGLDPNKYLDDNDSYSFFNKTGNLIITGPTGTNVCDVRLFLLRPA
jgi:glycerate-2-kinase